METIKKTKRQDTTLESEGAEFLVLGHLLIEGISAYKAYINFPGYDLTAVNPDSKRVARIQVKSRWATDYGGSFPLKSLDCEFVVHVALNRGYRYSKKNKVDDNGIRPPHYYIFPIDVAVKAREENSWRKVHINRVESLEVYRDNWNLIINYLANKEVNK